MSLASIRLFRGFSHALAALFNNRSAIEHAWQEYKPAAEDPQTVQGRWLGEWVSETNGHCGELKCLLIRVSPGQLEAKFLATFRRFLRVGYSALLDAVETDTGFRLKGQFDLGALAGGIYHYEGEITPAEFKCAYRCGYDHGIFRMKRLD